MRCPNCGTEVTDGLMYCPQCGATLGNQSAQQDYQSAQQTYEQPNQSNYQQGYYQQPQQSNQNQGYSQAAPVYSQEPYIPDEYKPISMWGYFGYELLFAIPCVGLILLIVFSFAPANKNLKNFARSYFCFLIIVVVLVVILLLTGGLAALTSGLRYM